MRVLVLDGDTRSALSAVRSLGQRGHLVITSSHRQPALASASRYAAAFDRCPDPCVDESGFVGALGEIVSRRRIDVLLPMTEVSTLVVTMNRARFPPACRIPFASAQSVSMAADKSHVTRLARTLGIPVPLTIVAESAAAVLEQAATLPFPLVVKASRSRVRTRGGWSSTRVAYATDRLTLERIVAGLDPAAFPLLLQERIAGDGMGVFICMWEGRPVARFAHRRIREKPPSGGVSVLSESVPMDPLVEQYAVELLRRLDWQGVAMIEFKKDNRDGTPRLMEINGRFWGSLQLAVDSGVDFPSLLVDLATGRPIDGVASYRVGVRSRWLAGDLDALLAVLRHDRRYLNLPQSHPGKLRSLLAFLRLWGRDLHYEVEKLRDPGPARLEWGRRLLGD